MTMRPALLVLTVLLIGGMFAGCIDRTPDAMKSWGTTATLDLPVNVTRAIAPSITTFTFTPQGDEKYVLVETKSYAWNSYFAHRTPYECPRLPITIQCETPIIDSGFERFEWYRDAELTVSRQNGSVESYTLPTRGDNPRPFWLD